jgi:hypothetical protein
MEGERDRSGKFMIAGIAAAGERDAIVIRGMDFAIAIAG